MGVECQAERGTGPCDAGRPGRVLIVDDDAGETGRADADRAHALGALTHLTKPFDPCALASFVAGELVAARVGAVEPPPGVAS